MSERNWRTIGLLTALAVIVLGAAPLLREFAPFQLLTAFVDGFSSPHSPLGPGAASSLIVAGALMGVWGWRTAAATAVEDQAKAGPGDANTAPAASGRLPMPTPECEAACNVSRLLREREQQIAEVFEVGKIGTWSYDIHSDRLTWHGDVKSLYGLDRNAMPTRLAGFMELVHEDDRTPLLANSHSALTHDGEFTDEFRVVKPDGTIYWLYSRAIAVRDSDGRNVRVTGVHVDITKRKLAELALQESERQIRMLADAMPQIVWTAGPEGNIEYTNERWTEFTGLSFEETSRPGGWGHVIHPDDLQATIELWTNACSSGRPFESEHRFRRASDGTYRWHLARAVPVRNQAGQIVRWFGTATDIEEVKQAQSAIRTANQSLEARVRQRTAELTQANQQTAQAEAKLRSVLDELRIKNERLEEQSRSADQANQAKSDFLAAMSHEIRTPLNAILGMADLLWESNLDADQRRYVDAFRRSGGALMSLINDILDLSKIEAGRFELERAEFNLIEVIDQVVELVGSTAQSKGLSLSTQISPRLTSALVGDPTRLRQILINLIGNAVKFTERGKVVLAVRDYGSGVPGEIYFEVADTGIGIPEDRLPHIFDAFTQADPSITRKYGGTGLGLGISRRLVQQMGGQLRVTSRVGEGSTFSFSARFEPADGTGNTGAPANRGTDAPDTVRAAAKTANSSGRGFKILVAEDSADNRLLLQAYMKGGSHELTFVEDGRAAVERCTTGEFDLVLMDMQMPVMDGLQATQAIRSAENESQRLRTPIVALTAHARRQDAEASQLAGCDGHLTKPITKQKLLAAIALYAREAKVETAQPETQSSNGIEGGAAAAVIDIPPGLEDIVPDYLAARRLEIPELIERLRAGDYERARTIGHNLSGSGESYGFPELTRIGAAIEQAAKQCDRRTLEHLAFQLQRYLEQIRLSPAA